MPIVDRRKLFLGAAAALVLAGCSRDGTDGAADTARSTSTGPGSSPPSTGAAPRGTAASPGTGTVLATCQLTPQLTAGPYHLDGHLARRDITEDRAGLPVELRVQVLDVATCRPLVGAAVDVWHCDAGGEYSGFNGNSLAATQAGGTNDKRFLRGVQLTDDSGTATFDTVYPGWYEGRAVHIHLEVLDEGTLATTYEGGHVAHVGQLFFDEATNDRVMALDPYRAHTGARTRNETDTIFAQAGPGAIATLRPRDAADPSAGYVAEIACTVDPAATPPPAPMF